LWGINYDQTDTAMKKVNYLFMAVLSTVLSFQSCDSWEQPVTGSLTDQSDCKSSKSAVKGDETSDTLSCINYIYVSEEKKLSLTHINAGFNCCPGKISCRVSLDEETLIIKEKERTSMCDCDCLFDLGIEIDGVEAKNYLLKFEEPYCVDQEQLIFEVDLKNCPEGSFCVTRKQYPWGMSQY